MEGSDVGMALARIGQLFCFAETETFEEPQWIAVPARRVEIGPQVMMIEFSKEAHEVVDDVASGRKFAQNVDLSTIVGNHFVRGKAAEGEPKRRTGFGHRQIRQVYVVKRAIFHAPEDIAPCRIQVLDRGITHGEPIAEPHTGRLGKAQDRIMAAIFIVGLPRDDRGMIAISFGQRARDACGLFAITGVTEAIVAA